MKQLGPFGGLDWLLIVAFALSTAAVLYLYFGYPLLLLVIARLRPRPVAAGRARPTVTMVVPAHDEAAVIGEKVDDCLAQEYPAERLEVLVVSDGSTDRTEEIVGERAARDPRVRLVAIPRSGKAAALDQGALTATGEILVLTDANALLAPGSLARLVEPFADPMSVACAGGNATAAAAGPMPPSSARTCTGAGTSGRRGWRAGSGACSPPTAPSTPSAGASTCRWPTPPRPTT
jgi:cellulose synthase/poly-beta-1,6-N-acetylglucosamine synthase-like glycosyltransferase